VLVIGETTMYRSQLGTRADSPAHRRSADIPSFNAPVGDQGV
jgi:hypothetical protein